MSDEDDWFERALRDSDADSDAAEGDEDDETGESNEDDERPPTETNLRPAKRPIPGGDDRADERGSDPFGGIRNGERDPSREAGDDVDEDNFAGDVFGSTESESDSPKSDLPEGDDPFGGESFGGDDPFGGGSFGEEDPFGDESANDGTPDPTGSGGDSAAGCSGTTIPLTAGQRAADQRAAGQRAVSPLTADRQTPSAGIGERRRRLQWAERCRIR